MSSTLNTFIAGDTLSKVRVKILDSKTGSKQALSGIYTAQIIWSINGGSSQTRSMTVLTGADDGFVEYQFEVGELTAGTIQIRVKLTETLTGRVATTVNEIKKEVGANL